MKRIFFYLLIGFLGFTSSLNAQEDFRKSAPKPGPAPRIELGEADQVTFKNLLKVIVVEDHKLPRVSIQVFVDYPPVQEGEYAGYVSMAGQMLSKGTTNRTKAEIDEAIDFIGASLSTSSTGIRGSCLTKHKDKLLEIMTDILYNPTFPEDEFEKLKKQTLSALAQQKDDPNAIADNVSSVLRFGKNHPYGEVETEETINNITVEKCREFYDTYFKPNISYLIITGDLQSQEAKNLASKHFSKWENQAVKKVAYEDPAKPSVTQVDFVDKAGAVQSVINVTYPVELKPGAPDAIKASVMNTLLGGYFSSRLNANLREDKGYTYGARSVLDTDPVIGYFNAYASVRNEVTDSSLMEMLDEIRLLQNELVEEKELTMVKNVMTGNFARALEDPATVARFTLNTARFNLPEDYYATYLEKLNNVTREDVMVMAKKYLTTEKAHILVVGNKDEVAEKLREFSPQRKINFYDVSGNIIDEAGMEVPPGITAETVIADYISALGGTKNLNKIENVSITMKTEVQGMEMESNLYHMAPNKLNMVVKMMGNIIQQTVFDGEKGTNMQMGNFSKMEESEIADAKINSHLFPERSYDKLGVKTELKGMELINGRKAYRMSIEYPSGTKVTDYFDAESSLKVRSIKQSGDATITEDIGNYKEVNGILFPHERSISGLMPVPLVMETVSVEVNTELDEDMFEVE